MVSAYGGSITLNRLIILSDLFIIGCFTKKIYIIFNLRRDVKYIEYYI